MNIFFKKLLVKFLGDLRIHHSLKYLQREQKYKLEGDYVRLATLELSAYEIYKNKLNGTVAELGVYRGDFAKHINLNFPDKIFYLFDTFEGFDNRDVKVEKNHNFSRGEQNFSDTSIEVVLQKMTYPQNCIVKKGFFPATAEGVEDQFCFVSLDVDLYQPIYEGLHFFYPRLIHGGYIFVHDFNNDEYPGVRKAVEEFCSKEKIGFLPIPDYSGTVIISK